MGDYYLRHRCSCTDLDMGNWPKSSITAADSQFQTISFME